MQRGGNITLGIFLIVIGLGVTAFSYSTASPGGSYVVAWGAVLIGVIRVIRGLAAPAQPHIPNDEFEQSLDRTGPSRTQIAGRPCVHCKKKIISVSDGEACAKCEQPVHADCASDHRREKHPRPRRPESSASRSAS